MSVLVNDFSLASLVWNVCEVVGHVTGPAPERQTAMTAGGVGVWTSAVSIGAREVMVGLDVRPASLLARDDVADEFRRRLAGELELKTVGNLSRFLRAQLADVGVEFYPGNFAVLPFYLTLRFRAVDPARVDVEPLVYGLSSARTACPVGTAPSYPLLWIFGACTNPVVIVRNHTGAEVRRCTFAATLGADDYLVIDRSNLAANVQRVNAGAVQTGAASGLLAYASGVLPVLAPEDASPDNTAHCTVELSAASGTPTGLIHYARRWS